MNGCPKLRKVYIATPVGNIPLVHFDYRSFDVDGIAKMGTAIKKNGRNMTEKQTRNIHVWPNLKRRA